MTTEGDRIQAYERRIRELENKIFTLEVENRQLRNKYVRADETRPINMDIERAKQCQQSQ